MSFPLPRRKRHQAVDYQFHEEIGDGALSKVHCALEWDTGKKFAIKILDHRHLKSQHQEGVVRMEEHCFRRTNHPGIVKLYASFADSMNHYFVLEHCPGGNLWSLTKDVGYPDRLARHYFSQVIEAMSYLRDAQIVYRDLKAQNVLISSRGSAKLVDFGSSKDLANPHIKPPGTWNFNKPLLENAGTPNFMAPEVINNKCSDFRSDIWSLGCLIYQVLSGMPPFGQDLLRVYERALACQLRIPPGISRQGISLIKCMVKFNADDRLGAADITEIRQHPYFGSGFFSGTRFEGAHRQSVPVSTLAEACLHVIGRGWDRIGASATSWAVQHKQVVKEEIKAVLKRYQKIGRVAAMRDKRKEFTGMDDHLDSEASSTEGSPV